MRIRKLVKSERGVFEPALSEEDVVGQIRAYLEAQGIRVNRNREMIPSCKCGHYKSLHLLRQWGCTIHGCGCKKFRWTRVSEGGKPDLDGWIPAHWYGYGANKDSAVIAFSFYIEVKKPGGRKRISQLEFIEKAMRDRQPAIFADSVESVCRQFLLLYGIKLA